MLTIAAASAAPGDLDDSFGSAGQAMAFPDGGVGRGVVLQADGMTIVAGRVPVDANDAFCLARFTATGELDLQFGTGGQVTTDIAAGHDRAEAVAIHVGGKIIVAGCVEVVGAGADVGLARYHANGALDASFGSGGIVTTDIREIDTAFDIVVQGDGKIVVAGSTADSGSDADIILARYDDTGALDTAFGSGGWVATDLAGGDDSAVALTLQADGKIVVAGTSRDGDGGDIVLLRYMPDGALDGTFGTGGLVTTEITPGGDDEAGAVAVQGDGMILVAGTTADGADPGDFAVVRYLDTGQLDAGFGVGGKVRTSLGAGGEEAWAVHPTKDGGIVVVGHTSSVVEPPTGTESAIAMVLYSDDGTIDSGFGTGGVTITGFDGGSQSVCGAAFSAAGEIFVAGTHESSAPGSGSTIFLARYGVDHAPAATTGGATEIAATRAMLAGTIDPDGEETLAWFEYGTTDGYGQSTPPQPLGAGTVPVALGAEVTGLSSGTTYHYRIAGESGGITVFGEDASFTTEVEPEIRVFAGPDENAPELTDGQAAPFDFGPTPLGLPLERIFTITNAGTADLNIERLDLPPSFVPASGAFTPEVLPPGGSHTFAAVFLAHTAAGEFGGTMVLTCDDPDEGTFEVPITATAEFASNEAALDLTFGGSGMVTTDFFARNEDGGAIAIQPDGKIIQVGSTYDGDRFRFAIARYLPDGRLDDGFGENGRVAPQVGPRLFESARAVVVQPDGKIVVVGEATNSTSIDFAAIRCHPDGTLDQSFGESGMRLINFGERWNDTPTGVALQADGRIVIAGTTAPGIYEDIALVRLTANGDLDDSFGTGGRVVTTVGVGETEDFGNALAIAGDGRILVAGSSRTSAGGEIVVLRYAPDGSLDPTFGTGGTAILSNDLTAAGYAEARAIAIQPDDAIVVAGRVSGSFGWDFALARFTAAGAPDPTFGDAGFVRTPSPLGGDDEAWGMVVLPDGRIVSAGGFNGPGAGTSFGITVHLPDGTLDVTFGDGGFATIPFPSGFSSNATAYGVAVQQDGRIVLGGSAEVGRRRDFALARLGTGLRSAVSPTAVEITGIFTASASGTVDPAGVVTEAWFEFGVGGVFDRSTLPTDIGFGTGATPVVAELDRLLPGQTYDVRLIAQNAEARTNGPAHSFTVPALAEIQVFAGADDSADAIEDGQASAIEFGTTVLGTPIERAFTVKNAGFADLELTALALPAGFEHVGEAFASRTLAPDESHTFAVRFLAHTQTGPFVGDLSVASNDGDEPSFRFPLSASVAVVGPGSPDPTFGEGGLATLSGAAARGRAVALQSDGSIILAGRAIQANFWDFAVARYTANGERDPSFGTDGFVLTPVGQTSDFAEDVLVQEDGKIVVVGYSRFGLSDDFVVVRYTPDGALDPTFGAGGIVVTDILGDDQAFGVAIQADGKLVVAGRTNGTIASGRSADYALVRYHTDGTPDETFGGRGTGIVTTPAGDVAGYAHDVAVQEDGRILVVGMTSNSSLQHWATIVRYTGDGLMDPEFGDEGVAASSLQVSSLSTCSLALQNDGKVVIAATISRGTTNDFGVARYTTTGSPDPGFGAGGFVITSVGDHDDFAESVAIQSDGKIVVAGYSLLTQPGSFEFSAVRYTSTGARDTTFGIDGKAIVGSRGALDDDFCHSVTIQPDGRIVLAGDAQRVQSTPEFAVFRLAGDFRPTLTTTPPIATGESAVTLLGAVNPIGVFTDAWFEYGATQAFGTATQPQALGYGTQPVIVTAALAGLQTGRIYYYRLVAETAAGKTYGPTRNFVAPTGPEIVLSAGPDGAGTELLDGSPTPVAFDPTPLGWPAEMNFTVTNTGFTALDITGLSLPDGFEPVGGTFQPRSISSGESAEFGVRFLANRGRGTLGGEMRLMSNDSDEGSFDVLLEGTAVVDDPWALDFTFGNGGWAAAPPFTDSSDRIAAAGLADGSIVIAHTRYAGSERDHDFGIMHFTPQGAIDTTFGSDGEALVDFGGGFDAPSAIAVQPDGMLVVAGTTADAGPTPNFALTRIDSQGTIDAGFGTAGLVQTDFAGSSDFAFDMILQDDGRIVVAGSTYVVGVGERFGVARYLPSGAPDASFGSAGKVLIDVVPGANRADAIAVQPDGRIVIAGLVSARIGRKMGLARINPDGTLDEGFGTAGVASVDFGGSGDLPVDLALQPDGGILLAGTHPAGNDNLAIVRFTIDGFLDTTFGSGGTAHVSVGEQRDFGRAVAVLPDGSILVAGSTRGPGFPAEDFALARFRQDGTIDSDFAGTGIATFDFPENPLTLRDDVGYALVLGPRGKIVIAGTTPRQVIAARILGALGPQPLTGGWTTLAPDGSVIELDGTVDPNGVITKVWFEYGSTPALGTSTDQQEVGFGTEAVAVAARLNDLPEGQTYHYRLVAEYTDGIVPGAVRSFYLFTPQERWRAQFFGTNAPAEIAADDADPDRDGLINLVEWACHLDPTLANASPTGVSDLGNTITFRFSRSRSALEAGVRYRVQWSESLHPDSWIGGEPNVTIVSEVGDLQVVEVSIPKLGSPIGFVRLSVSAPSR